MLVPEPAMRGEVRMWELIGALFTRSVLLPKVFALSKGRKLACSSMLLNGPHSTRVFVLCSIN